MTAGNSYREAGRQVIGSTNNEDEVTFHGYIDEATELSANLFRIPPTEEKLRKGKAEGEEATKFHYSVAKEFRIVIEK